MSAFIPLGLFCVLGVFPATLPHTVRLVRRLQYQFTVQCLGKTRPIELSTFQHRGGRTYH